MNRPSQQTEVLVVGAGPTGLLLASELTRRGVPCQLIDAQACAAALGSSDRRSPAIPADLRVYGTGRKISRCGMQTTRDQVHSGGELLGTIDLAGCGSIYGFNVGLSEEVTESILTGYLHQHGGQVNRSSRLIGLTSSSTTSGSWRRSSATGAATRWKPAG